MTRSPIENHERPIAPAGNWKRPGLRFDWLTQGVEALQSAAEALRRADTNLQELDGHDRRAIRDGIANGLAGVLLACEADDVVLREAVAVAASWSGMDDLLHEALLDAVVYSMRVDPMRLLDGQQFVNLAAPSQVSPV